MDSLSVCSNSLYRHSNSSTRTCSGCWGSEKELVFPEPLRLLCSRSSTRLSSPKRKRKLKEPFGVLIEPRRTPVECVSPHHQAGLEKQLGWKYWEWPPSPPSNSELCSVPSDLGILPIHVCLNVGSEREKPIFPKSLAFTVSPSSVSFRQDPSTGAWDEIAWLRVQNKGKISRRLNLIPPSNPAFTVVWAATLKENTTVPPGLHVRILIHFNPQSDDLVDEVLMIKVEGDGGIVVPIRASPQDPPLLEIDDFSCGCCLLGHRVVQSFRIFNQGGGGRFWLLSEAEFMNEFLETQSPNLEEGSSKVVSVVGIEEPGEIEWDGEDRGEIKNEEVAINEDRENESADTSNEQSISVTPSNSAKTKHEQDESRESGIEASEAGNLLETIPKTEGDEFPGEGGDCNINVNFGDECLALGEDECEAYPPPNSPAEPKARIDRLVILPFRVAPNCFSLKGGQEIKIKVSFRPEEPKLYHEKVAVLCDNGEVRWFILKGLGFEPKTQKVITLHADGWASEGSRTTLDFGDLIPDEPYKQKLTIRNSSAVPLYYFWILHSGIQRNISDSQVFGQSPPSCTNRCQKFKAEAETEYGEEKPEEASENLIRIKISPGQGLLRGCREVVCGFEFVCPPFLGSYGSRLSLHIQQLSDESLRAMAIMSEKEFEVKVEREINKEKFETRDPFSVYTYMNLPAFRIPPIPREPTHEVDIWLRSIPLQCWFDPPILKDSGFALTQAKQKIKFFNSTKYQVQLSLQDIDSEYVNVKVSPNPLILSPHTDACLKVAYRFQREGHLDTKIIGVVQLPFKTVDVFVPVKICVEAPPLCDEDVIETTSQTGDTRNSFVEPHETHSERIEVEENGEGGVGYEEISGEDGGKEAQFENFVEEEQSLETEI